MSHRRADPLAETHRPHWLTISDLHRKLVACTPLPGGTDLRAALRDALEQCALEGWQAESPGSLGFTFIAKGSERRLVNLTPADPAGVGGAGYGGSLAVT